MNNFMLLGKRELRELSPGEFKIRLTGRACHLQFLFQDSFNAM